MMVKYFVIGVSVLIFVDLIFGFTYLLVFDDETVFKPCDGEEDNYITNWLDLSNVTFDYIDDDEVLINGNFIGCCPVSKDAIPSLDARLYKMMQGNYQLPLLLIRRSNLCTSLFNPMEIWYPFMDQVEAKFRTCPSVPGSIYPFYNYSTKDIKIHLPDPNLAGGYRVTIRTFFEDSSGPSFCIFVDLHLERV